MLRFSANLTMLFNEVDFLARFEKAARAVNVFGKVEGDPKVLEQVRHGEKGRLEATD